MKRLVLSAILVSSLMAACGRGDSDGIRPSDTIVGDVEGATTVSKHIRAEEGGTIEIPGGATLEIPPGALEEDTEIHVTVPAGQDAASRDIFFLLEPAELEFAVPVLLTFPYQDGPDGDPLITVYQSSPLHPVLDLGSESTDWASVETTTRDEDANELTVSLAHFTFIYALVSVDDYAYLVIDMPPKYLKPGDMVFVLTSMSEDPPKPCWAPGHPGIYEGYRSGPNNYSVIEATPPKVCRTTFYKEDKDNPGQEDKVQAQFTFKGQYGHLFMGPRRPDGGLTHDQREDLISWARDQIGTDYAMLGQGNLTNGSFSCVALCEAALDTVDAGVLDWRNEALAQTPLELYKATRPVNVLYEDVGVPIDIPIYGVTVHKDSPAWALVFRGWYQRDEDYVITASDLPSGATFSGTPKGDYHVRWTPQPEHAGQSFTILLNMTATPRVNGGEDYLPTLEIYETLTIHVNEIPVEDTCEGKECGKTAVGLDCGDCEDGQACVNFQCVCNATSCAAGCCLGDDCKGGTDDDRCGTGGLPCSDCAYWSLECVSQACACTAKHCQGCCEHDPPLCRGGDDDGKCGAGGQDCVDCTADGLDCVDKTCECGGKNCAGCCDGSSCYGGDDPQFCGSGGEKCAACDPDQECKDGACVCTAESCPDGCCHQGNQSCVAPPNPSYCGLGGAPCVDCAETLDPDAICEAGACALPGDEVCCSETGYCQYKDADDCDAGGGAVMEGVSSCDPDPCGCGNGVKGIGEECDGDDFGDDSCQAHGFDFGDLACTDGCAVDTEFCYELCGDGEKNWDDEECDGADLGENDCTTVPGGFEDGELGCTEGCQFDTSGCWKCGDGKIDQGEECDGGDLGGQSCATLPGDMFGDGLACSPLCTFDTSGCGGCGNNAVEPSNGEDCDGWNLDMETCYTLFDDDGLYNGTLACKQDCTFDLSGCAGCGNDVIAEGEQCETPYATGFGVFDLNGQTCQSLGYDDGELGCDTQTCLFNTLGCWKCGDGTINPGEDCEGDNLNAQGCATIPGDFTGGDLGCTGECLFDTSGCWKCGDGVCEGDEDCENCIEDCPCPAGTGCVAGECICVPSCVGKECGDDGCGGQCTPGCDEGQTCEDGACISPLPFITPLPVVDLPENISLRINPLFNDGEPFYAVAGDPPASVGLYDAAGGEELFHDSWVSAYDLAMTEVPVYAGGTTLSMLGCGMEGCWYKNQDPVWGFEVMTSGIYGSGNTTDMVALPTDDTPRFMLVEYAQDESTIYFLKWSSSLYGDNWTYDSNGISVSQLPGAAGGIISAWSAYYGEKSLILITDQGDLWWVEDWGFDTVQLAASGVGADLRRIRCLDGHCGITDYGSQTLTLVQWSGPETPPEIKGTVQVGDGAVGLEILKSGDAWLYLTTGMNDGTYTITEVAGDFSVVSTTTAPLDGCPAPAYAAFFPQSLGNYLAVSCHGNGSILVLEY